MNRRTIVIAVAGGAVVAAALWWRKHPSACPYSQRFWVEAPLQPKSGETVLEVGPGTGCSSSASGSERVES